MFVITSPKAISIEHLASNEAILGFSPNVRTCPCLELISVFVIEKFDTGT